MKDSPIVLSIDRTEHCSFFKETFDKFFNIVTISDPAKARGTIDKQHQDIAVVISDHGTLDITGTSLLTSLKKDHPHIVRVLATDCTDLKNSTEAIKHAQIYAHLTKPWNNATVIKTLFNAIAEYKSQRALLSLGNSIAHEMRNPLGQIKYYLQNIAESTKVCIEQTDNPEIKKQQIQAIKPYIEKSNAALDRGLQVIDMILEDVKCNSINEEDFTFLSAKTLIEQALAKYAYSQAREKETISLKIEKDFIFKGDQHLFLFVIFNLLKNTFYYLPSCPALNISIQLRLNEKNNSVVFTDTGPGIAKEQIAHIFRPFFSIGKSNGTGLGLAFCKRVMESFKGSIECESQLGEYTRLTLCFPQCDQRKISNTEPLQSTNNPDKKLSAIHPINVLLVEDDRDMRNIMKDMFSQHKINLLEAEHGERALTILNKVQCDLIIMDINMPIMDGWETTKNIRESHAYYKNIPIIGLSSYGGHNQVNEARKKGMNDYLQKPANWETLSTRICQWLPEDKFNLKTTDTDKKNQAQNQTQTTKIKASVSQPLDFNIPIKHYQYKIDTIKSFLKNFAEENTDLITELKTIYEAGDYQKVAFRLHKLLPLIRMFHFKETTAFIQNLEDEVVKGEINNETFDKTIKLLVNEKLTVFFEAAKDV